MKWYQQDIIPTAIWDETHRYIADAATSELAAQIVKDHNAGDASLTEEQKDAIRQEHIERSRNGLR